VKSENLINFALGLVLILVFLNGYFHEARNTRFKRIVDPDHIIFPGGLNATVVLAADRLAFWICAFMAGCTVLNGALAYYSTRISNISGLFVFVGLVGGWVARFIFIVLYKNKPEHAVPKLWPGSHDARL
jgi:hypothetical protein